jgi:hypothetical protein
MSRLRVQIAPGWRRVGISFDNASVTAEDNTTITVTMCVDGEVRPTAFTEGG